ncbi:uncharacterized protein C19orf85 homolog [Spea bombifrons]|uniref:uncharacterized protein C19orf85 homolog n=1 Tax=Spea bombifrons TaxID=233779 RepID=UPI00234B0B53|nr:uncharacterized protein C19orf85 homolog [Spea bombifrons]
MPHQETPFALHFYPHQELGYYNYGHDLFTFITVASSHIMRTLQRPKKSRPTKRKVNHRRFLQNQICRKYAVIEAATQKLAHSILSQEAESEKQLILLNKTPSVENGMNFPRTVVKNSCSCNLIKLSANLPKMSEVNPNANTFLGIAEAYLVPDGDSSNSVGIETLAYVSDEVSTVESIFHDITTEDVILSPCSLLRSTTCSLYEIQRSEEETNFNQAIFLQSELSDCKTNAGYRFPKPTDATSQPELQIPRLVRPIHNVNTQVYSNFGSDAEICITIPQHVNHINRKEDRIPQTKRTYDIKSQKTAGLPEGSSMDELNDCQGGFSEILDGSDWSVIQAQLGMATFYSPLGDMAIETKQDYTQ